MLRRLTVSAASACALLLAACGSGGHGSSQDKHVPGPALAHICQAFTRPEEAAILGGQPQGFKTTTISAEDVTCAFGRGQVHRRSATRYRVVALVELQCGRTARRMWRDLQRCPRPPATASTSSPDLCEP